MAMRDVFSILTTSLTGGGIAIASHKRRPQGASLHFDWQPIKMELSIVQ
jgi:hypothetical protein